MNELKAFFENVGNISFSVYKWISKIDWKEINNIIDFIANKFPVEYEKLLLSLMDRGWLIWVGKNDSLTYFNNMFDCLVNKDVSEQDNYMKIFTKNIQESLIEMLLLMHPQRSQQIKDSFEAHNNNLYYASIPSLIALSEGVCRDYFPQIGLFKKQMNKRLNKSEPETIDMFKNVTFLDIFEEIYLKPLKVKSKITETITKKPIVFNPF